ncbi:prolyl oligopeptidase family serine peptidase [Anaeromyxobacter oryzae]|uniref:prolyl oligopeptidase n=1 Tax=Anaeromyxobacter oryzae TaxID=2918170 RepID=A0ABN6MZX3_9BACT|nr:prolyl oligopeptidase family serine peptidase [Anaeromyxobacter oryzae]BDG05302.1 prolyl endopeptidase [Anaeromyxobacter oryzae]
MLDLLVALALSASPAAPVPPALPADRAPLRYPETRRDGVVDDFFGTKVADPYRWLEDPDSPDTQAWVQAQNALTQAWLAAVPERAAIRDRLTRLFDFERFTEARRRGGRVFFLRNSGLQNQSVLWVADRPGDAGRVLLDPNGLSPDGTVALSEWAVSEDGKLLAYALADAGSDWLTWRVRDVETGADRPDVVSWSKASRASFTRDGSGFFYSRYDAPKEGAALTAVNQDHQVWFHRLGTKQDQDRLVFRRQDQPEWYVGGEVTLDGRWLVITASKGTNPETSIFLVDLARPEWKAEPFLDAMDATYAVVGNEGDTFYVLTNKDAPRSRLVAIRRDARAPAAWRTIVPEAKGRDVLASAAWAGGRLVVQWMRDAHDELEVWGEDGKRVAKVKLPALGTVRDLDVQGPVAEAEVYLGFSGFTTAPMLLRLDAKTGALDTFRAPKVAFDGRRYVTRQVFYRSKDGTRIPMFLVHRKGIALDGRNPTLLYGYGGFNIPLTPEFKVSRLVWLEMGGVYAMPNLRGGGEYGKEWYDAGRLARKQNVFDDCIAAAQWLVSNGYTTPSRLAVNGGSNGGLLVGAVETQRPDLFGAAVPEVGVLDMLRFHRFTLGWGWKSDYGSAETKEGFDVLYRYSPLHAVKPGTRYPPTLVVTADHDDRVVPAHSHKFTAALQAAQAGDAPILTRIETRAGHGAGKPTSKQIEERADVYAFLVRALGMELPAGFGGEGGAPAADKKAAR